LNTQPGSPWRAVKFITKSHASAHIWFEQEISILRQLLPTSINIHLNSFESKAAAPPKSTAIVPQSTPHPNIVNMFEVYETSTDYVIVMEWLTGEQLFGEVMRLTNYTEKVAVKQFDLFCMFQSLICLFLVYMCVISGGIGYGQTDVTSIVVLSSTRHRSSRSQTSQFV
jgi:serine/threonine protein kinase